MPLANAREPRSTRDTQAVAMSTKTTAEPFLPARLNLKSLREAAAHCEGCDLYKNATQTVFGEGRRSASIILLGEVPGDEEDKQGHPFVGPAGRLLDETLETVGLDRDAVYVTNAVKHFRWGATRQAAPAQEAHSAADRGVPALVERRDTRA